KGDCSQGHYFEGQTNTIVDSRDKDDNNIDSSCSRIQITGSEQKKQKLTRRSLIYDSENGPSDEKLAAKRESCASSQCQTKRILNNLKSEVPVPFISLKNFIYYSGHTVINCQKK
ncbi:hypothetical protein Tco_0027852, partial [Tanacetum coccineum]